MTGLDIQTIERVVRTAQQTFPTPSLSLAVIQDGEIVYENGFGTRTLGVMEPVDEHTSYAIASMSKSTVSTILGMMVDAKKLSWQDRVVDLLPSFRLWDEVASRGMRVIDLMIHGSGLVGESGGTIWYGSNYDRREVVRRLRFLRPVATFREEFMYQNVAFLVGGEIIEAVSGKSWDTWLKERVFEPLGMNRSFATMAARDAAGIGNIATPYAPLPYGSDAPLSAIPYRNHDNVGGAASVHSTAHDLALYLRMFLGKGTVDGVTYLSEETVRDLHTPMMIDRRNIHKTPVHPRLKLHFPSYGLGWFIDDYGHTKRIYHSGGVDGMRGRMSMFPELNAGVVVLSNSENNQAYMSVIQTVEDMLLGWEPVDWIGAYEDARRSRPVETVVPVANTVAPETATICGVYEDSVSGPIEVTERDGAVRFEFVNSPAFRGTMTHVHYDTFRVVWDDRYVPDGLVTFYRNHDGVINALHLEQPRLLDVDFSEMDASVRKVA